MKLAITLISFFISFSAVAEYRVFTLHIVNAKDLTTKQVETTLDPEQFISFYPLNKNESISYIETWRCKGRTDFFKDHCSNPRLSLNPEEKIKTTAKLD